MQFSRPLRLNKQGTLRRILLLVICSVLGLLSFTAQAQAGATWTIIYYGAADNDLEPFLIGDLMEMQAVGSTDDVNVVVQFDRAEGYDDINGGWSDTRRFLVTAAQDVISSGDFEMSREAFIDQLRQTDPADFGATQEQFDSEITILEDAPIEEFEQFYMQLNMAPPGGGALAVGLQLQSLGEVGETDTGDPAVLVDYALWAIENFPAENYVLLISNHGGGWTSLANDEDSGGSLTMPEIDSALAEITSQAGIEKFDMIAFDACLMAQLEVLDILSPYAEYAVAAEETIPGAGYDYVTALGALVDNPAMTAPEFGQVIVDGYMDYYTNVVTNYEAFDLHVFDLASVASVQAALEVFSSAVQANPADNLEAIGNARNNAQIFSADDAEAADFFSSVDLVDFMTVLIQLTPDGDVQAAAQGVIDAISSLVIYGAASPGLPGANGVAIYFPANPNTYALADNNQNYPDQMGGMMDSWLAFLSTFQGEAVETYTPEGLNIAISDVLPADDVASIWDPPVVLFQTDGQGIVDLQFFAALQLEDGQQIILDQSPLEFTFFTPDGEAITQFPEGPSDNEFTWNVEMPLLTDGQNQVEVVLNSAPDDPNSFSVKGIYRAAGSDEEINAYLVMDGETSSVTSVVGVSDAGDGGQVTREISVDRGDTFEPLWSILDENGELSFIRSETVLTFGDEPFTYTFVPAASGTYVLTMWTEDIAGNIAFDSIDFSVDNTGLDENYRGFKDVGLGINFLFPWSWADPDVTQNEDESYTLTTTNPEGNISIIVNAYEAESVDDILNIALTGLDDFGAIYDEPLVAEMDYEGYVVYYSYDGEDGPHLGGQLIVYVPENGLAYIIDVGASEAASEEADFIFQDVVNTLFFFPPVE